PSLMLLSWCCLSVAEGGGAFVADPFPELDAAGQFGVGRHHPELRGWAYCTSQGLPLLFNPVETVSRIWVPSGRMASAVRFCPTTLPAGPRHWLLSVAGP